FPTLNPFQSALGSISDAFVTKLAAADGKIAYSTYLGGSYFGALGDSEAGYAIAVDSGNNIYVAGVTDEPDFPTANAFQPALGGVPGTPNAFVAKFNPGGSQLLYSTFLGGSIQDAAYALAVDASGDAYVTGATASTNFPTLNPFQGAFG